MLDEYALALLLVNNSLLVPWYLMCGYLYEHKNISVISDFMWDQICEKLLEHFNSIEHHHKPLIDPSTTLEKRVFPCVLRTQQCV